MEKLNNPVTLKDIELVMKIFNLQPSHMYLIANLPGFDNFPKAFLNIQRGDLTSHCTIEISLKPIING